MCGIAGFTGPSSAPAVDQATLEAMIGTLRHRGQDGFGYRVEPGIGLAHARLSIIDLATGDQPIHNPSRTVWTIFNGEIFNYVELRAELKRLGHRFYLINCNQRHHTIQQSGGREQRVLQHQLIQFCNG